jgi:SAM-dependent methyltransferase
MTEHPQTWHYGLVARWWAEFNEPEEDDLAFFGECITRFGEPVLDGGCGTGRMLIPLLQQGHDVDGSDLSPDMLAFCRTKAEQAGYQPKLYEQALHELELPRQYRTIYLCGVFGIGGYRQHDIEALRRLYRQLEPGGALVFDHVLPYHHAVHWPCWLPGGREHLPESWPDEGTRRQAADGDEIELRVRLVELDPLEQRVTAEIRATLQRAGTLVAEEVHTFRTTLYFRNELLDLLEHVGFVDIEVRSGCSDAPAAAEDTWLAFIARKPA